MDVLQFSHYGELREVNATAEEQIMFDCLKAVCPDLELCRKSDSYVSAVLGETDVARFKFTPRAKWIQFPYGNIGKIRISRPDDVSALAEYIKEAVEIAIKVNN